MPGVRDEVHALLVVQSADEPEQRHVVPLRQAQLSLERSLALQLSLKAARVGDEPRVPVAVEEAVVLRGPLLEVYAVDDARELVALLAEQRREAPAAHVGGDLPRVSGGNRDDLGRKLQSRLHLVHALAPERVVEVEVLLVVIGKLQGVELVEGTAALERHVVDDKHRPGVRQLAVVLVVRREVHGEQRRVPVVGHVHEVAVTVRGAVFAARHVPDSLDGRLAEHGVAEVSRVPVTRVDVIGDGVVALVVDEDGVHAVLVHVKVPNLRGVTHHVERDPNPGVDGAVVVFIPGHHHHHSMTPGLKTLGKRRRDVAQAASLGEGRALGRHDHDVELLLAEHLLRLLGHRRVGINHQRVLRRANLANLHNLLLLLREVGVGRRDMRGPGGAGHARRGHRRRRGRRGRQRQRPQRLRRRSAPGG
mmetsp:Transcript_4100/g.16795  ORF Transcript_4100/g.16795 Transcript_4100/m.16795 type:complete len:420 (+) Transcript_4100:644-1903(+)